jgi:hypothetical protein
MIESSITSELKVIPLVVSTVCLARSFSAYTNFGIAQGCAKNGEANAQNQAVLPLYTDRHV